jgi:hypothetical protein
MRVRKKPDSRLHQTDFLSLEPDSHIASQVSHPDVSWNLYLSHVRAGQKAPDAGERSLQRWTLAVTTATVIGNCHRHRNRVKIPHVTLVIGLGAERIPEALEDDLLQRIF